MQGDLCAVGFVINEDKSIWVPTQSIEWLGTIWDTNSEEISIRQKRVDKAKLLIENGYKILADLLDSCPPLLVQLCP